MSIMEIKQVGYSYDNKKKVLKGVSAEMEQGKLYAILGPSGCGKTTLLSLIGGLDSPGSGQIYFDGQDIAKTGLGHHRKNHVAFIFQAYNLIDYLTPAENVSPDFQAAAAAHSGAAGADERRSQAECAEALWRPAAACGHRPCPGKRGPGDPGRRAYRQSGRGHRPGHYRDPKRERPQDEQVCGGRYSLQRIGKTGRCGVPAEKG